LGVLSWSYCSFDASALQSPVSRTCLPELNAVRASLLIVIFIDTALDAASMTVIASLCRATLLDAGLGWHGGAWIEEKGKPQRQKSSLLAF
jgi:hypothetical protein